MVFQPHIDMPSFRHLIFPLLLAVPAHAAPPETGLDDKHRALLREHCHSCHNAGKQKGKVRLDDIDFSVDTVERADLWQKVLNSINSGEMPPEDETQPPADLKTEFLDDLSRMLVAARERLSDSGGEIAMRRLNRREYQNTIRDLLGVEINARELPADGGAGTFDTVGSSLFMSSDQFEQYLALGRQALDEHFARYVAAAPTKPLKIHLEAEGTNERIIKGLRDRTDARERYLKWTAAVEAAGATPENAKLAGQIRAEKKDDPTHLTGQWDRIKGAPSPATFGFTDAIHAEQMGRRDWDHFVPHHRAYVEHPLAKTGSFLTIDDAYVNSRQLFQVPADWPPGDYVVRVRIAAMDGIPRERRFMEFGPQDPSGVCTVNSTHEIAGTAAQPQLLEIPLKLSPSKNRIFMFRERGSHESDAAASNLFAEARQRNGVGPELALWIDWIEVASKAATTTPADMAQKLRKDPEQWANQYMPIYAKGYAEKYERFRKWCTAIDEAAKKPGNAEAVAKLRADPRLKTQPHLFYNGFARIEGAPAPAQFGFRDVDDAQFARSEYTYHFRYYDDYRKLPARETGSWLMLYSLGRYTGIAAPEKWPAGRYTLRICLAASDESPKERRFIEIGTGKADAADFNVLSSHQVTGTLANPQTLEIPVTINATGDRNFAIRDKRPNTREAEYAMFREAWDKTGTGPRPCIWIDHVELEGPQAAEPPAITTTIRQRREVELHANAMVGGTYNGYYKEGHRVAKAYLDSDRTRPPTDFGKGIADEQEATFRVRVFEEHGPSFERYLNDPLTKTGAYLTIYNVHTEELITLPPDQPSGWLKTKHEVEDAAPGEYVLRFHIGAVKGTPKERHFVELGSRQGGPDDFTLMRTFQISGTTETPQTIEVPVSITAGGPRTFVLREKRDVKLDGELYQASRKETKAGPPPALWLDWVEWEGPLRNAAEETLTNTRRLEPESRRADVERGHLRFKYLNEQYAKWQAAGADEARLNEFDFTDKANAEFAKVVWDQNHRWFQQYLDRPLSRTGLYLDNTVQETSEHAIDLPADLATGDYVMRVKIGRVPGMPAERAFLSFVEASPIDKDDRTFLANKQITAPIEAPEVVELPFRIRPGGPRKFILMEKRPLKKEAISLPGRTRRIEDPKQRDPVLWIDWIEWEGPVGGGDSRTGIPPVLPAGGTNARAVLESFANRAFRGKQPGAAFLDKLAALHDARIKAGDRFDEAIRKPLSVILASPGFLYLQESGPGFSPNQEKDLGLKPALLSQNELASRVSYFLWSAPPDEQLLKADLKKPETLAREVDRMLASPKADEFISGFVHQWLHLDRLDFFQFDTKQFRDFDESTKAAARREVYESFAHLLRKGGSLSRLLKSDEVHVNGLLATYYGIEGVSGDEFRPVKVPAGSPRGGLLGMAAVLAMGSNGERTSPVERGAWVLRYLLHNPPPPAPPNVPQLDRLNGKPMSPRERLAAHMEEAQCASCHRRIDPIGFGLENFNAAGKWREVDHDPKTKKEWPIDPAGAFHRGPAFNDYFELRDLVAAREGDFARGFTEALIEYALGRPCGFTDEALAGGIVARAKEEDYAIRGFIRALVASETFGRK